MSSTTIQFKRQLPRNSFFQVLTFFTQIGVGIWLVPYLVHNLGTAAYGLIPIAGMLTQYVSMISQSITGSVSRFLTISLQQGDIKGANRVFSTAFFSYLVIGFLEIPLFAGLICYAGSIISIPTELYNDAIVLLTCSAAAFVVDLVASVFGVPMYANNRLDISRSVDVGRYLLRVTGIVSLFVAFGPALRYVGYVDLTISLVLCAVQAAIAKHLEPGLRLRLRDYDWREIQHIMGMGGWLVVDRMGTMLLLAMGVWICNRFVSPEAGGEYAALKQLEVFTFRAGSTLSVMIAPMIMIYYAHSEMNQLVRLCKTSTRILSLLISVPIGVLCVFSSSFLQMWLGASFAKLAPLLVIMVCHLGITVGLMPLHGVLIAMNRVKVPAMVCLGTGALSFALAILFAKYLGWGIYGVAIAGAIVLPLRTAFFTAVYAAVLLHEPWHAFLRTSLSALGLLVGLVVVGQGLNLYFVPASWPHLVLGSSVLSAIGLAAAWALSPKGDREMALALVPGRFMMK